VSRTDRLLLAGGASALLAGVIGAVLLVLGPASPATDGPLALLETAAPMMHSGMPMASASPTSIVVDVEGAVARAGIQRLPAGSRVADAIAAAGGYAPEVDLAAAAAQLNLAKVLADGEQVHVPIRGAAPPAGPSGAAIAGGAQAADGGLVNINTATPEELEALPGIGPVTVQKIVAARQERPFASLDEAVERGVLNRGQLEDIRDLATAG
jgi:competence protein ComEA